MAYTLFNGALPNGASQNGTAFGQSARDNLNALRDACVMGGGFFGFALTAGTPAAEPTTLTYKKGTEWIRASLTWTSGNVTQAVYEYSANSGGVYSTIGTKTITFDGSGNVTNTSWA